MTITRRRANQLGAAAIAAVLLLQAFNSFACYKHDLSTFLSGTFLFVGIPLLPAVICLGIGKPLRAVGACTLVAPWLLLAYYTDCVRPYTGGGASMIYVAVVLWGTVSSIVGALVTGLVARVLGIEVTSGGAAGSGGSM